MSFGRRLFAMHCFSILERGSAVKCKQEFALFANWVKATRIRHDIINCLQELWLKFKAKSKAKLVAVFDLKNSQFREYVRSQQNASTLIANILMNVCILRWVCLDVIV